MLRWLLTLGLSCYAVAQYTVNGTATITGNFTITTNSPGGPPNFISTLSQAIIAPPATPNMGGLSKNGTIFFDTSYPVFPSPVVRCTDTATAASGSSPNQSLSAGLQGSGDAAPLFNANDTLVHVNNSGGSNYILPFNPSTLVCSPAITANLNQSSAGSSTTSFNFGTGYFDWQNSNLYHGGVSGNFTQLMPYSINPSTGTFTVGVGGGIGVTGAPEVDFQYGLPLGSLVAAWQPSHSYTQGQYVSYNLSQSFTNLDDSSANWGNCATPACAGGTGTGTASQTFVNASPSQDGNSSQISCGTVSGDNCLFYQKPAFDDTATSFITDAWVNFPSLTAVGNLEYDTFQAVSISGTIQEFMWGTQCNYTTGFWQIWNQGAGTWNNSTVTCTSANWAANTWHHYILKVHRVAGDTSCAGSAPCQYFDSLTLDGTTNTLHIAYPSSNAPMSWAHVIGTQFQIDLNGSATATEYLDEVTLTHTQATDWTPSYSGYALGDLIYPTLNNPQGNTFKLVTTGTTGSSEPTWTSGTCFNAGHGTQTDGTTAWRPLGGCPAPVFTYQLTSASGTSGSSTPAFVPVSTGHPDLLTTVSDNSLTWTNTGVLMVPGYRDIAGVSFDGTRFCADTTTNDYGYNGSYTGTNGGQGSSIWAVCYSSTLNEYVTLNTATGWQSITSCVGGAGFNCSGGTFAMAPVGSYTNITTGGCGFFIHNMKADLRMSIPTIAQQGAFIAGSSGCPNGGGSTNAAWSPFATFFALSGEGPYLGSPNHWAMLNGHLVDIGQNSTTGFTTGIYSEVYQTANPGLLANILVSWQPTPCDSASYTPGYIYTNPPCGLAQAYDSHTSGAYNPGGTDTSPVCGSFYNLQTLSPVPFAPWQGEFVCIPTSPTWAIGGTPTGQNAPWRFTHEFNTGTNSFFDTQFTISQVSSDGKFAAFTSDWMCSLGSTAGGSSNLCGLPWLPSTVYTIGQNVNPFSATGGGGTNFGVYQVTTGGTSAAVHPTWFVCNSGTVGNTVTDSNGVVYTCQGSGNARGDVFIVELK